MARARASSKYQVKVSSKYQIVIPRAVRQIVGIQKGQTVSVIPIGGVIEVVPDQDLATLEGAFPELSAGEVRDESEREYGLPAQKHRRRAAL